MFCPRLSTHAVGGILNKHSCTGRGQEWPPSSANTRSRGGQHALGTQRAESMEQGIIQKTAPRPEGHFICGCHAFSDAMPLHDGDHHDLHDAILASVDPNLMLWMAMWALAGRRQQDIKKCTRSQQGPGKSGLRRSCGELGRMSTPGLNRAVEISAMGQEKVDTACTGPTWDDGWLPNHRIFLHKYSWSQGWICLLWLIVQSPSHVWLFATLWTAVCQASLSFTVFWSLFKLMSIESVMPSNHLILCQRPFSSCPQSFPASGSFSKSLLMVWPIEKNNSLSQLNHQLSWYVKYFVWVWANGYLTARYICA